MEHDDHIEVLNQVQITAKYKEWSKVLRIDSNMTTREFCSTLKEEFDIIGDVKVLRTNRVANVLDLPAIKSQLHNGDVIQIYLLEADAPVFRKSSVYMWGHGKDFHESEELKNVHLNVKQIACGSDFKVALTENDEIYTWGRNNFGQLGNGTTKSMLVPTKISSPWGDSNHWNNDNINNHEFSTKIYCGPTQGCITRNGRVWLWGTLSTSIAKMEYLEPREIHFFLDNNKMIAPIEILHVALGLGHCAFVAQVDMHDDQKNYVVFTLGLNECKQLGHKDDKDRFTIVAKPLHFKKHLNSSDTNHLSFVKVVGCGPNYTIVAHDNIMLVWGKFIDGKTYKEQLFRIDEDPEGKIAKLICDESFVLILTEQGKVHGWGNNQRGMIGLGPRIAKFEFATKIKFIHNDKEFIIKDIAAGPQHVAAIDEFGFVWTWGKYEGGRLGFNFTLMSGDSEETSAVESTEIKFEPTRVINLSGYLFTQLCCATDYCLAIGAPRVFGADLETLAQHDGKPLPTFIEQLLANIDARYNDLPEGLFRIPSSNVGLAQIRMTIDRGMDFDWSAIESINDAINLLKLYLQELPDPLFTHKLLQEWNSTKRINDDAQKLARYKELIQLLPQSHRLLLLHVLRLLHVAAAQVATTKMSAKALAIVMTPNMLRAQNPIYVQNYTVMVQHMIEAYNELIA
jgi:alpha-tubulin suppressor-like RCC1 family protein